jgi:hypothetical protein
MSLFPTSSAFADHVMAGKDPDAVPDSAPPEQTIKRLVGRQIVEEPVQKYGKTIVATDDLEGWYRELEELARGPVIEEERTDALVDLRDSVYRYLR